MTVIPFPLSPDMGLQIARDILRADPDIFPDEEVRHAARFLMDYSPDWKDVQTANMVLHALGKKHDAKLAEANVWPRRLDNPRFVFWVLMGAAVAGIAIQWWMSV